MKTNYKRLESNSVQNLLNLNDPEPAFYYLTDHLGSTSYIVNDSAQITQKLAYMPFGEDFVDLNYNTPYP
ncbi:MAG: hypothetical protein LBR28_07865, partial [Bacteroidales bacterium]|nr:hypothetical protein [Bacteroidales bacterium]